MAAKFVLILLALLLANLPFLLKPTILPKVTEGGLALLLRLIEWFVGLLLLMGLARYLEALTAPLHQQHWQFYVTVLCMHVVFAFPGFVYCFLWRRPGL